MGTVTLVYTTNGHETRQQVLASGVLAPFTGSFTMQVTSNPSMATSEQLLFWFVRGSDASKCYMFSYSMTGTTGPAETDTVPTSIGSPWECLDWSLWSVTAGNFDPTWSAGLQLTFTLTGAGIPTQTVICAYGTQKKEPAASVMEVGPGVITEILQPFEAEWAIPLIIAEGLNIIDVETLCSGPPPPDSDITAEDWRTFAYFGAPSNALVKVWNKFQIAAWNFLCQCTPATGSNPPPVSPTGPNLVQPTSYVTINKTTITNYDISTTLNLILRVIQGNQTTNNNMTNIVNQVLGCACGGAYTFGPTHDGLVDTGEVEIGDRLRGLLVQSTYPPDQPSRPGNPPYIWDLGWMSISNSDGVLQEQRVTRDSLVWLPGSIGLATSFNWILRGGVTLNVTELLEVAQPQFSP